LAADEASRTLWVSDYGTHTVRAIDLRTSIIRHVAGQIRQPGYSGDGGPAVNATLGQPIGLAFDSVTGDLLIAELVSNVIRAVNTSDGRIRTFAGTGALGVTDANATLPALEANLSHPQAVAFDSSRRRAYIADTAAGMLRAVEDGRLWTVHDCSGRTCTPASLTLDPVSQTLFFGDISAHIIVAVSMAAGADGSGRIIAGQAGGIRALTPDGAIASAATLSEAAGVRWHPGLQELTFKDGRQLVPPLRSINADGILTTIVSGSNGQLGARLRFPSVPSSPRDTWFDAATGSLYIADDGTQRIWRIACDMPMLATATPLPFGVSTASPTPCSSSGCDPFSSGTASPSPTAVSTASPTPAPSTAVRLSAAFEGSAHAAHGPAVTASLSDSQAALPATVVSRSWPAPTLRLQLAQGCIAAAAVQLRCFVDSTRGQQPIFTSGISQETAASSSAGGAPSINEAAAAVAAFPSVILLSKAAGEDCLAWPASGVALQLHDNSSYSAGSSDGSCPLVSAAASGYLQPVAQSLTITCRLLDASGATSVIIAETLASVLLLRAALPIPRDIMIHRPARRTLESMRTQAQAVVLGGAGNATALVQGAGSERLEALLAASLQLQGPQSVGATRATAAQPAAIAGATTLVVTLDASASSAYPSLAQLQMQARGGSTAVSGLAASNCSAAVAASLASAQLPLHLAVYVGSMRANVTWVSPDGSQVHLLTPAYEQLCGSAADPAGSTSRDCGYQPISLVYESEGSSATRRRLASTPFQWLDSWLDGASQLNATASVAFLQSSAVQHTLPTRVVIQCPPWCPNTVPIGALPLAVADAATSSTVAEGYEAWMGSVVPAQLLLEAGSRTALGLAPLISPVLLQHASGGLYYTSKCSAAGFTDWETGACSNTSDPAFGGCAFGAGSDCTLCPRIDGQAAAICPGGFRAIPLPGFYTPAESSGMITKCAAPSTGRCAGWNASTSAVQCGDGYAPYSAGCLACAPRFYTSFSDGACVPCPSAGPLGPMLQAILIFVGIVAAFFSFIFVVAYAAAKLRGGSIAGGSARALDLLVWVVALLQLLAQVGRSAETGLPPLIASTFRFLAAFQFESVALPAACWSGYAFTPQVTLMSAAIALSAALGVVILTRRRCVASDSAADGGGRPELESKRLSACNPARRLLLSNVSFALLFGLASVLYAPTANVVLGLLACTSTVLSPLAYASLDKDIAGNAAHDLNSGTITVSVLTSNPTFVCYQGSHLPAAVLAWVALALVTAGYPAWTLWWSRARVLSLVQSALARELSVSSVKSVDDRASSARSKTAAQAVWLRLQAADAAALRAILGSRRVWRWVVYAGCGREWLVRRFAVAPAAPRIPRPSQEAALVAAVQAVSRREIAALRAVSRREAGPPYDTSTSKQAAPPGSRPGPSGTAVVHNAGKQDAARATPQTVHSPSSKPSPGLVAGHAAVPGLLQREACNTCVHVVTDGPLRPFVGSTFRASASYAQQVDAVAMSVLAAIQWFWQRPMSTGEVAGRACLYVLTLVSTAWIIGTRNPFWPHDAWKLYVKVGSLLLAALAAVVTHLSLAMTLTYGEPPDTSQPGFFAANDARTGLAYCVFAACIVLALVLMLGFWAHTVRSAEREAGAGKRQSLARQAFLQAAAGATGSVVRATASLVTPPLRAADHFSLVGHAAVQRGSLGPILGTANPLLSVENKSFNAGGQRSRRLGGDHDAFTAGDAPQLQYGAAAAAVLRRPSLTDLRALGLEDDAATAAAAAGAPSASKGHHALFAPTGVGASSSRLVGSAAAAAGAAGSNRAAALLRSRSRGMGSAGFASAPSVRRIGGFTPRIACSRPSGSERVPELASNGLSRPSHDGIALGSPQPRRSAAVAPAPSPPSVESTGSDMARAEMLLPSRPPRQSPSFSAAISALTANATRALTP
jgi:hypothetical protein